MPFTSYLRPSSLCAFIWKCEFEKLTFKVSCSYNFKFERLQKMLNAWWDNILGMSQKLHGGGRGHIEIRKKIPKSTNEFFFTHMPTSITRISKQACVTFSLFCWSASHIVHHSVPVTGALKGGGPFGPNILFFAFTVKTRKDVFPLFVIT